MKFIHFQKSPGSRGHVLHSLLLLVVFCVMCSVPSATCQPEEEFLVSYQASATGAEWAYALVEVSDGYICGGQSDSFQGSQEMFLQKINFDGDLQYTTSIGAAIVEEFAECIEAADSSGLYCVGYSNTNGLQSHSMVHVDYNANILSAKRWGESRIYDVTQETTAAANARYIGLFGIAGEGAAGYNAWIAQLQEDLTVDWVYTYGGSGVDDAKAGVDTGEGNGWLAVGSTDSAEYSHGQYDIWALAVDMTGAVLWSRVYGGADNDAMSWGGLLKYSVDSSYLICGWSNAVAGSGGLDGLLLNIDVSGNVNWVRLIGGANSDQIIGVTESLAMGGFALAMYNQNGGNEDAVLAKVTATANALEWAVMMGGDGADAPNTVIETSQTGGGFLVNGRSTSSSFNPTGASSVYYWKVTHSGMSNCASVAAPALTFVDDTTTFSSPNDAVAAGITRTFSSIQTGITLLVTASSETVTRTTVCALQTAPSSSPSSSQSASQTASVSSTQSVSSTPSLSPSQTPSQTASSTQTASQTASVSLSSSQSPSSTVSVSASPSYSTAAGDGCADNDCHVNATCVVASSSDDSTLYYCDCSDMDIVHVGEYCMDPVDFKRSVSASNCPICASLFLCSGTASQEAQAPLDDDEWIANVPVRLAEATCDCANPRQDVLQRFVVIQAVTTTDAGVCIEVSILPGLQNNASSSSFGISAKDLAAQLSSQSTEVSTTRPLVLPECTDQEPCDLNRSAPSSASDSLLYIIIGVVCAIVLLVLGIVWYTIHRRVSKQYRAGRHNANKIRGMVEIEETNNNEQQEKRVSTAWA